MKISYDVDDMGPCNHRLDLFQLLRERYPKLKVTMFTIPWDIRFSPHTKGAQITDKQYAPWVATIRKAIEDGWMEVMIHGLTHGPREFEHLTYQEAKNRLLVAQKMFINVKIPYQYYFKAPQWLISTDARKAITDMGFKVVDDHYYNWNIRDEMPKGDTLIAHGHINDGMGCDNGIDESFIRLCKIPHDAEWCFLSEMI